MVRTIIQLTEVQAAGLRKRAKEQGISMSALIRESVESLLAEPMIAEEIRRKAAEAVGFVRDVPDLAANHDRYLAEAQAHGQEE